MDVKQYMETMRDRYTVCMEEAFDLAKAQGPDEDPDKLMMLQKFGQKYMTMRDALDFCLGHWDQYCRENT